MLALITKNIFFFEPMSSRSHVHDSLMSIMKNCSCWNNFQSTRFFSFSLACMWQKYENERHFEPDEDFRRVWNVFTYDFRRAARRYREAKSDAFRNLYPLAHMKRDVQDYEVLPVRSEILIIGGGLTGSSVAYWLKEGFRDENLTVTVVENPDNFAKSRSMLSSGAISQQFSIPEFVDMALFSAEFLRHAGEHLKILDNDPPDINLLPIGFMQLAQTQEAADKLNEAWKIQVRKGAHVAFLSRSELERSFPAMNFDDVISGTYGLENEGIIDTWQLLSALREKNMSLGVRYIKAEVEGFTYLRPQIYYPAIHGAMETEKADSMEHRVNTINGIVIRPQMTGASARPVLCYKLVNAAGPWAGEIAQMGGIGKGDGVFSVPVPIVCTRRTHFLVHAPDVPALQVPILFDPNGIFCHPDSVGHNFVCGRIPTKVDSVKMNSEAEEPSIDYNEFYETVLPILVKRIPAFKEARVINAWHSYEDVNTFDGVPIFGEHFHHTNFYQMCGLGGYGPQISLAIGKLYSELVYDDAYTTINVRKFDMRRIMMGNRFNEIFRCS